MTVRSSKRCTRWIAASMALSVLASACADVPTAENTAVSGVSASAPDALQQFTALLAKALNDPSLRGAVHAAMKSSQFNEHKLVLQDFAATSTGARVIGAMAAAGGVDETVVRGWIRTFPSMDLYVPFTEHRRSWTGGGDIVVAANMDVDDTRFTGFSPDGASAQFNSRDGVPAPAVIFMHPAEDKAVRDVAAENGARRTIEDASRPASNVILVDGDGNATAGPAAGGARLNTSSSINANYTGYLNSYENYEGDGVGGIELYVQHYAGQFGSKIDGASIPENSNFSWTWGWGYDDVTYAHDQMWFSGSTDTWIRVEEKDQWSNDYWGSGKFGGFGSFVHRFHPSYDVKYISHSDTACFIQGQQCGASYVDIYYTWN